jgi:CheY-like chemotaxis protein
MFRNTRILIADTPDGVQAFRRALSTPFAVEAVTSLDQARQAVQEPPAVVVCGCHFDEGKMYDLLRHLKASPPLDKVPFIAVRCVEGEMALDGALYESVKIAVRALGGNAFVDLLRWQRRYGEAEAGHRLTRLVETLAQAPQADTG